ncbi:MAG: glycoside hydrolase family 38 C-terminal domain-containing protein [Candidatus Lokiarchaeota archaeon]
MKATKVILVPETHWDREWYLPFQEFRARLVLMMDKLLNILKANPNYKSFTLDGQIIPIEDYLEVRPEKEKEIKKYVKERRLSIGPMYILPDEFLVSGESLIQNLLIGHKIANNFGDVMKAGYIPDPFGHIAQLPQILKGFKIPSVLFWRGFGNEFEDRNLNVEFIWKSPCNSAEVIAIHLILSYGSLADIRTHKINGKFKSALRKIRRVISSMEKFTGTPILLLNNGSDHHEALAEIPEIIKQWNEKFPMTPIEQNDFEYYISQIQEYKSKLKQFEGELRNGRYAHLLPGVLSTRMWIKQRNTKIEYLFEKYTEPMASIAWILTKTGLRYDYPQFYILTGLKWLIKNHPHDSICGCSIDQVHNEMKIRFDWAEQIGEEVYKNSVLALYYNLNHSLKNYKQNKTMPLVIFNPLAWKRKDIVKFEIITDKYQTKESISKSLILVDSNNNNLDFQIYNTDLTPRYQQIDSNSHEISFLTEVPALGYKLIYLIEKNDKTFNNTPTTEFRISDSSIENKYYQIEVEKNGCLNLLDKESKIIYQKFCFFEDKGDWGDEYDFSGPKSNQKDLIFTSREAIVRKIRPLIDGPTQKILKVSLNLKLPSSLTNDRIKREEILKDNPIEIYISLYREIKRIDIKIKFQNQSKDHRLRALFNTNIKSKKVYADGHFYIVPRSVFLPEGENWIQKPQPTNHQKDFVAIDGNETIFALINRGLPEYEAIVEEDQTITFAITLLRCIEWLSRGDFKSRNSNAGPNIHTPEAQCLGDHEFQLSVYTENKNSFYNSNVARIGKEYNCPLKVTIPEMTKSALRISDKFILNPKGIISYLLNGDEKNIKYLLPNEVSFIEVSNKMVQISALKKSEKGEDLILRGCNLSINKEKTQILFYKACSIEDATSVNLLEEKIDNPKFKLNQVNSNQLELIIDPAVIFTIKIKLKFK